MRRSIRYFQSKNSLSIRLAGIFLMIALFGSCGPGRFVTTRNHQCQVYDPEPMADQLLDWSGGCADGYASGYGILSVYEREQITYRCTGNMSSGRFEGDVSFLILKDTKPYTEYLESWKNGRSVQRIQNSTLKQFLAPAKDAREYLHRLKLFRQDHPDVWIDDFNDVLLGKTFFACTDVVAVAPKDIPENQVSPKDAETKDRTNKKICRNELLIKIADDGNSDCGFYTLFNHRVASLKKLVSDRYKPGGSQFFIARSDWTCDEKTIPEELPLSGSCPTGPENENNGISNQGRTGEPFYYPAKRY